MGDQLRTSLLSWVQYCSDVEGFSVIDHQLRASLLSSIQYCSDVGGFSVMGDQLRASLLSSVQHIKLAFFLVFFHRKLSKYNVSAKCYFFVRWNSYISGFSRNTWIAVLAIWLLASAVFWLSKTLISSQLQFDFIDDPSSLEETLLMNLGCIVQQGWL